MVEDNKQWLKTAGFFAALALASYFYPIAVEVTVFISVVIIVHELGHFFVAKASGIRVEVLSLGFGAPLVSIVRGGTRYQIAPIPLGGYMKPAGEFEEKEGVLKAHGPDEFLGKPWYVRGAVLLAGPSMNFVAPILVLFALYATVGRPFFIAPPMVMQVAEDSAAEEAGIKAGDQIIKLDGQWVTNADVLRQMVDAAARSHPGKKTQLLLLRESKQRSLEALPRLNKDVGLYRLGVVIEPGPPPQRRIVKSIIPGTPAEKAGFKAGDRILSVGGELLKQGADFPQLFFKAAADKSGAVAVELARAGSTLVLAVPKDQPVPDFIDKKLVGVVGLDFEFDSDVMARDEKQYEKMGLMKAAKWAPLDVLFRSSLMVHGVFDLFAGRTKLKESLSGPVAIARMAHQQAKTGVVELLLFMVNISLILGIMNLLPVPLLDGGTFLLCVLEGIRGKALGLKAQALLQNVSGALLISLMLFATYNDILNYFHTLLHK